MDTSAAERQNLDLIRNTEKRQSATNKGKTPSMPRRTKEYEDILHNASAIHGILREQKLY